MILKEQIPALEPYPWLVGIVMAFMVGIVIIGGIKRIGSVTSKMVPFMCGFYCIACLFIIFGNIGDVPTLIGSIFSEAFNLESAFGGFVGVLIQGIKRASFSNEAGLGSAAIAHAAAKTNEPVREGIVAMLGPFIDTIVVCTMTALALLITGAHTQPDVKGVEMTSYAFAQLGSWMPALLAIAVVIFAYSTAISWSYYGDRATEYLFGEKAIPAYRLIYVLIIVLGPVLSLGNVIDFSDLMILSLAFPNIIGVAILSHKIVPKLKDYVQRLKNGEFDDVQPAKPDDNN